MAEPLPTVGEVLSRLLPRTWTRALHSKAPLGVGKEKGEKTGKFHMGMWHQCMGEVADGWVENGHLTNEELVWVLLKVAAEFQETVEEARGEQ